MYQGKVATRHAGREKVFPCHPRFRIPRGQQARCRIESGKRVSLNHTRRRERAEEHYIRAVADNLRRAARVPWIVNDALV